jgi:dTDP-glucose pyrophosphorylase
MDIPRQAIILAAGKGTRLGALTAERPKALVEVANRPLLDHVRQNVADAGVERAIIVVSHLAEQVEAHVEAVPIRGLECRTVWQPVPQGTGQAVKVAVASLKPGPFWITYTDILVEPSEYARMATDFGNTPSDIHLAVNRVDDPSQGAAVYFDDDLKVGQIVEKPPPGSSSTNWNSAGVYIARPALLPHLDTIAPSPRGEYELPDAITSLLSSGGDVRAFCLEGWWSDVGRPADVQRVEALLRPAEGAAS